jgi:sulfite reductase (ferredoxin)
MIDLVATLLFESQEKYEWTVAALEDKRWADAIYHAYSVFISAAKALLLDKSVTVSNQTAVINKFDENFVSTGEFAIDAETFSALVLQINQQEPTEAFANQYVAQAEKFLTAATSYRQNKA